MRNMILILEDDIKMSELIATAIKGKYKNANLFVANDADKAAEIMNSVRIDIIISDINLGSPIYTGIDFVKDMLVKYPELLVIFQSDIDDKDFRLELHEEIEYLTYVTKDDPNYEHKLLNKVGRALDITQEFEEKALVFTSKFSTLSVDVKNLMYVKTTDKRNVLIVGYLSKLTGAHMVDEIYGMTLKGILEMLGEKKKVLFRVQQGILINPAMILKVDHVAETIRLAHHDLEFSIGREYKQAVRRVLYSLMERW